MKFPSKAICLCAAVIASLAAPAFAQKKERLSVGPTSLQEIYQDWRLSCTARDDARACVVTQDQTQQNGQRLLAVEIGVRPNDAVATLLLPFGILFDNGVSPQIDEQAPLQPVRFRTCLPTGCIAILPIDAATLAKLRAGSFLKLTVTTAAQTSMTFPVSLNGLTGAIDRLKSLTGS